MRALVVSAPRDRCAVGTASAPRPAERELLISVEATSINPIDVYVATGEYRLGAIEYPLVPGHDFAGRVEQVGDEVRRFAVGDPVLGMWSKDVFRDGSWAQLVTISEDGLVTRWPTGLAATQAAALPLAALTAALALQVIAPAPGERLVVVGAAGAVGRYAVQLAAQAGAQVIATARAGSEEAAVALGAHATVDPGAGQLADALRARFPGGVPALIDLGSGRRALARLAELVTRGGRVVSARHAADVHALAARGIAAHNIRTYDTDAGMLAVLAAAAASGELSVALDGVVSFDELPGAVGELAAGRQGKLAVELI